VNIALVLKVPPLFMVVANQQIRQNGANCGIGSS